MLWQSPARRQSGLWGLWPTHTAQPARARVGWWGRALARVEEVCLTVGPSPRSVIPRTDALRTAIGRSCNPGRTGRWLGEGVPRSAPEPYRTGCQSLLAY